MKLGRAAPNYTIMEQKLLDCAPPEIAAKAMLLGVKIKKRNWTDPPTERGEWYVCSERMILGTDIMPHTDPVAFDTPEEALAAAINPHKDGLVWL